MTHRARTLSLAALLLAACAPEPERPNLLLVTIDTLRADRLGCYGYERPTSPHIDAFAEGAVVFESAQASSSWTLPSLASVMTGHLSSTHSCWDFASSLDASFVTLAEHLRDAGFDTGAIVNHTFLGEDYGLHQGFVHFDDELLRSTRASHRAITSEQVAEKGLWYLRQKAAADDGSPWFLWLHFFDPHDVYQPHAGLSEAFGTTTESDLYDGEIAFTDAAVGRVLAALDELGLAGSTVVALVADHGEEFGDHGGKSHGFTLFAEQLNVPLIVRAPGVAPARIEDVVRGIDLPSTLVELVGAPPLADSAGRSVAALLDGMPLDPEASLAELRLHREHHADALVADGWKLVLERPSNVARLFDLARDPGERDDVAADEPERVARMRAELERRLAEARAAGTRYNRAQSVQPLPSQLRRITDLGYAGEDD